MDEELWFEEEIFPAAMTAADVAKGIQRLDPQQLAEATGRPELESLTKGQRDSYAERFAAGLKGRVLAYEPLARRVVPGQAALPGAEFARGALYQIRLGMQYKLLDSYVQAGCRFRKIWCRAYLGTNCPSAPRVLDMAPDHIYEGERRTVRVEAKPALKWNDVEASLGSAATDIQIGVISPATVAFELPDPHWEMTERQHEIRGRYHFWLLIDVPDDCDPTGVWLTVLGEGDVYAPKVVAPLGPKQRARVSLPPRTLADVLVRG
ncbi:hypothetical protein [Candidatus Promineifilum breve]|nr:hypothetical protein [Candidatus Promineifilum breve]